MNNNTTSQLPLSHVIDWCRELAATNSFKWKHKFSVYLYLAFYGPVTVSGMGLNVLTLVVLHRMARTSASYYIIKVLAVYDAMYSACAFCLYPLRTARVYHILGDLVFRVDDYAYGWEFITVTVGLYAVFVLVRNWCVVLLSFERLVVVAFPLKSRLFWTRSVVNAALVVVNLFAFVARFPSIVPRNPLRWRRCNPQPNSYYFMMRDGRYQFTQTALFLGWIHFTDYWVTLVAVCGVPILSLIAINTALIAVLFAGKIRQNRLLTSNEIPPPPSSLNKEKHILKMAASVVIAYMILESPHLFHRLYRAGLLGHGGQFSTEFLKLAIGGTLVDSNVNFYIYCLTNAKFKVTAHYLVVEMPSRKCREFPCSLYNR
ncbi:uncharacterized protein LOC141914182 [Tubulanus polymorphus]|uniref:uncharacterized protein LOC141914182 n=1 Tax=Tubulanus polymorphus TaxID=672921 RepID=UPI003DA39C0C